MSDRWQGMTAAQEAVAAQAARLRRLPTADPGVLAGLAMAVSTIQGLRETEQTLAAMTAPTVVAV